MNKILLWLRYLYLSLLLWRWTVAFIKLSYFELNIYRGIFLLLHIVVIIFTIKRFTYKNFIFIVHFFIDFWLIFFEMVYTIALYW
jgi:hypothetical protein